MEIKSTPHARGSTCPRRLLLPLLLVYPACAGIHPLLAEQTPPTTSTPHARGSTWLSVAIQPAAISLFPACAWIHRYDTMPLGTARLVYFACAGIHLLLCVFLP